MNCPEQITTTSKAAQSNQSETLPLGFVITNLGPSKVMMAHIYNLYADMKAQRDRAIRISSDVTKESSPLIKRTFDQAWFD